MAVAILLLVAGLAGIDEPPRMNQVGWLRGCWEAPTLDGTIEAQWLPPRASSILGVTRTIHGARLVDYEMDLIRELGERLSYEAHPSKGEPALFLSIAIEEQKVVFVFAPAGGNQPRPPAQLDATKAYVRDVLGAKLIYDGAEVTAYEWTPPPSQRSVVLP